MRCLILTAGTLGDVLPFVALGKGLHAAGHAVTLCTHASFQPLIVANGLAYAYLNDTLLQFISAATVQGIIEQQSGVMELAQVLLALARQLQPGLRQMLEEEWAAAQGAEVILYNPQALGGYHLAERLGVPGFMSVTYPAYVPTRAFPFPVFPELRLGGWYNRFTYTAFPLGLAMFGGSVNPWRKKCLGLKPHPVFASQLRRADGQAVPVLLGYSQHVVPSPADWPPTVLATGYWCLDQATHWQPPVALLDFLAAGPPPVYIGFGSMTGRRVERLVHLADEALEQAGQRGVVALPAPSGMPCGRIFWLEAAPHDWLFPHLAVIVHHGGAGTTGAGLRAGKPTVICPVVGDQPFWGRRIQALGIGPKPIPKTQLTASRLAQAIRDVVSDEQMRQRAEVMGEKLRAENGVVNAVEFIQKYS